MAEQLLTIKEIAKRLGLPESNIRYYRDKFEDYIPHVGQGRKRRYREDIVEKFSMIADGLRRNTPTEDIVKLLSQRSSRKPSSNMDYDTSPTRTTGKNSSQTDQVSQLLQSQAKAIEELSALLKKQSDFQSGSPFESSKQVREQESFPHVFDNLGQRLERFGDSLRDLNELTRKLEGKIQGLEQVNPLALNAETERLDKSLHTVREKILDMDRALAATQDAGRTQLERLDVLRADVTQIFNRLESLQIPISTESIEPLQVGLANVRDEINKLWTMVGERDQAHLATREGEQERWNELRAEVLHLSDRIDGLTGQINDHSKGLGVYALDPLRAGMDRLNAEIIKLWNTFHEAGQSTDMVKEQAHQWDETKAALESLTVRCAALESRAGGAETESLELDLGVIKSGLGRMSDELIKIWNKMHSMTDVLNSAQESNQGFLSRLDEIERQSGTEGSGLKDKDLEVINENFTRLGEEIVSLVHKYNDLEQKTSQTTKRETDKSVLETIKAVQEHIRQKMVVFTQRLDDMDKQMAGLLPQGGTPNQAFSDEFERLRAELQTLDRKLEDYHEAEPAPDFALEELRERVEQWTPHIDNLEHKIADLEKMVTQSEPVTGQSPTDATYISASLARLGNDLTALTSRVAELDRKSIGGEIGIAQPLEDVGEMGTEMARLDKVIGILNKRLDSMDQKLATEIESLQGHVRTCWAGVQKVSKVVSKLSKGQAEPSPSEQSEQGESIAPENE